MNEKNYKDYSDVDLAYKLLNDSGKENPLHYKELILDIIEKKEKPVQNEAAAISEIYTKINMDSRFQYEGNGLWGLVEWNPPETKRVRTSARLKAAAKKATEENQQE